MELMPIQIVEIFRQVANTIGISTEEFEQGLGELNFGMIRLSTEVAHAESQGLGLQDAAFQADKFPLMNMVHLGVRDILVLEVPAELVPQAVKARYAITQMAPVDDIRFALAEVACMLPQNSLQRALARFALFEAVRLNLLVASHDDRPALAYADIDDAEISKIAEDKVRKLIEARSEFFETRHGPIRPLDVMVAAALDELSQRVDVFSTGEPIVEYIRENCEARAELERKLNQLPARDALLIRNWVAPEMGGQRLTHKHLVDRHKLVFYEGDSPDALNQRLSRAKRRLLSNDAITPTAPQTKIIDILTQEESN